MRTPAIAPNIIYVTDTASLSKVPATNAAQAQGDIRPNFVSAKVKQLRHQTTLKHPKYSSQSMSNVLRRRTDQGIGDSKVIASSFV